MNTDNIREAFEAEVRGLPSFDLYRFDNGEYISREIRGMWWGYQASHAASEKRIALLEELVNKLVKETELDDKEIETLHSKNEALQADNKRLVESVKHLAAVIQSVNRSKSHEVNVLSDDEVCYWQRKDWVEYILEEAEKAEQALSPTESLEDK